jgi:hypothetical protein
MRQRTFKGFFLPRGLRIKWLGIDIEAPPRPPPPPTILQLEETRRQRRAEERFQRRRTRGDNIGEGGQRIDANYDSDAEPEDRADRESLPGYKADTSAPVYLEEWREDAARDGVVPEIDEETADAIRRNGDVVVNSAGADDGSDRMLSVAEYEARIRGDTNAPARHEASSTSAAAAAVVEQERQDDVGEQTITRNPLAPMPAGVEALRRPEMARLPSSGPPIYADLSRQASRNA